MLQCISRQCERGYGEVKVLRTMGVPILMVPEPAGLSSGSCSDMTSGKFSVKTGRARVLPGIAYL
jgi:hypothetical protein